MPQAHAESQSSKVSYLDGIIGFLGVVLGIIVNQMSSKLKGDRAAAHHEGEMEYRLKVQEDWHRNEYPGDLAHMKQDYRSSIALLKDEIAELRKIRQEDHDAIIRLLAQKE